MNPKSISIINFVVVLAVIFCNYYFNAVGSNGNTVGSLSDQFDNLFTPAGYAFAILGILRLNMERWDAPLKVIAFVWWPICLYSGWISVAMIANISSYLVKTGFTGGPFSEETWATIMMEVATMLALFLIFK